jgi:hypothetical protein
MEKTMQPADNIQARHRRVGSAQRTPRGAYAGLNWLKGATAERQARDDVWRQATADKAAQRASASETPAFTAGRQYNGRVRPLRL